MALWDDFYDAATQRVSTAVAKYTTPKTSPGESVTTGGTLFDLMYAYGSGKLDQVKKKVTDKFLASGTGKNLTEQATQQRVTELLSNPMTWVILIGFIILVAFIARKT